MEQYKNLDVELITETLKELFISKNETSPPFGVSHIRDNIYCINTGKSKIWTTKAGVEEFNRVMKEDFKNIKYEDE